jgi:ubiquinone/menaquinone biosynthesis C-methylase UbiE
MNSIDLYLLVRKKEGRLYPDEIAACLPDIPRSHPLWKEWQARADSARRLIRYLSRRSSPLNILDLGCGNGWLTHKLLEIPGAWVCGLDRADYELKQAARLFSEPHLAFLSADILHPPFARQTFDIIILASVIQYFPDLPALMRLLQALLRPGGEIHVLDSPLYQEDQLPAARLRTRAYYAALGLPQMAEYYHHHPTTALAEFSPRWLYHPSSLRARVARLLGKRLSPFPWIVLRPLERSHALPPIPG